MITKSLAAGRSRSWTLSSVLIIVLLSSICHASLPLKATIDPSDLAIGSRPLGMGRAFIAAADDASAIFTNPAGLVSINKWAAGSMFSKLIDEVDYTMLGAARSLDREALGLGYVSTAVNGSIISMRDPVTGRIIPDSQGMIGYRSAVMFLSYAVAPSKYIDLLLFKNVLLGGSVKMFSQTLSGATPVNTDALGFDLDCGVQIKPLPYFTLAAAGYNMLPYSYGGRLYWNSGIQESIPASFKAGMALTLFGEDGLFHNRFLNHKIMIDYDREMSFFSTRPCLDHIGIEAGINGIFFVRAGLDQDAAATGGGGVGVDNNLAAGVGLKIRDLCFDYAFHTFGSLSQNNTHFFSLSYLIDREKAQEYVPKKEIKYVEITEPADGSNTFENYVMLKGRYDPKETKRIKVNEEEANLYPDGYFLFVTPLKQLGPTTVEVVAFGPTGRIQGAKSATFIRLAKYTDVDISDSMSEKIGALGALGCLVQYSDGSLKPKETITRSGFLEMLKRAGYSTDVVDDLIKKEKKGGSKLVRAEAVLIVARYAKLIEPKKIFEKPYSDISLKHWAARSIQAAKKQGLLGYISGNKFDPKKEVSRMEAIKLISGVDYISKKIKEILKK